MARMNTLVGVSEDRHEVVLELREEDNPLAHIVLGGAEVEQLIARLSDARQSLLEEVAPDLDPGSRLPTVKSPGWRTQPTEQGMLLALRHPGLGWVGFHLEEDRAQTIAGALVSTSKL